jgi:hypothetical protein
MDINDLELVASAGVVFSLELKTAMQTSLALLKQAEKFKAVKLWGKVRIRCLRGHHSAYFDRLPVWPVTTTLPLASATTKSRARSRSTGASPGSVKSLAYVRCSTDGITWAQVTSIHPVLAATAGKIRGRFTGDLSHEYVVNEVSMFSVPDLPAEV